MTLLLIHKTLITPYPRNRTPKYDEYLYLVGYVPSYNFTLLTLDHLAQTLGTGRTTRTNALTTDTPASSSSPAFTEDVKSFKSNNKDVIRLIIK